MSAKWTRDSAGAGAKSSTGEYGGALQPAALEQAKGGVACLVLTLVALLPFVGKAVHLDDPFYIWTARQVAAAPLDFYGFAENWSWSTEPASAVNQNPPFVSFFLAGAILIAGETETSMHLAFLLPAFFLLLGTWTLAGMLGRARGTALIACLALPVVWVSMTTLMSDILMLSLYTWAVVAWMRGISRHPHGTGWLAAAGVLASFAILTKYFAVTLVPLFVVYVLFRRVRLASVLGYLLPPLVTLLAYETHTRNLYGQSLFASAVGFATQETSGSEALILDRVLVALVFSGGCAATCLASPTLWKHAVLRRSILGALAAAALWIFLTARVGPTPLTDDGDVSVSRCAHAVAFAAAGVAIVALPVWESVRSRSPETAVLALWILGTVVFGGFVNWTNTARAYLPLAPALAVILVPMAGPAGFRSGLLRAAPFLPGIIVAALVAQGDHALAGSARRAAECVMDRWGSRGERVSFQGHWGFQYYMQERGARPQDLASDRPPPADLLVLPFNNAYLRKESVLGQTPEATLEFPLDAWVSVLSPKRKAGFYCSNWGSFPYILEPPPPERYRVFRLSDARSRPALTSPGSRAR